MKAVVVASVILESEGKYLLVQQAKSRRQPGKWGPPGGKPEQKQGETLFEAAVREVKEETGLAIELTGFVGIVRSGHQDEPNLFVCFSGRILKPGPEALQFQKDEISDGRWLTLAEIEQGAVTLRSNPLAELYRRHQAGQIYPLQVIQHETMDL